MTKDQKKVETLALVKALRDAHILGFQIIKESGSLETYFKLLSNAGVDPQVCARANAWIAEREKNEEAKQ
jgi:hypothetical protein